MNTYTLNKYCGGDWNNYRVDHKINWSDKKLCRHFFFFDYFLNFNGFNPSLKEC